MGTDDVSFWQLVLPNVVQWWLVVQVIGVAGLPFTAVLFRALPDRGYAFNKTLGLLLTGYGAWLLAMLGFASFGRPLLVVMLIAVAVVGLVAYRAVVMVPGENGRGSLANVVRQMMRDVRSQWRSILMYEVIFLVALLFLVWVRAYNPHPWGTERPMDYAFFNAIPRSPTFPPYDPWLAGYSINYYYFGYLLMATVAILSGLPSSVAFNLSLALVFALAAVGVAGVLSNLVLVARGNTLQENRAAFGWSWLVAVVGVMVVLLAGNQAGALQIITGDHRVVALNGMQLVAALQQSLGGERNGREIVLPHPSRTSEGDFGVIETLRQQNSLDNFNWWWPSRALWDEDSDEGKIRHYTITEFPFFSFWLGDMHPHVMALPFHMLALAMALQTLILRPAVAAIETTIRSIVWIDKVLAGVVLGSLAIINSWDLPTFLLLYTVTLLLWHVHFLRTDVIPWGKVLLSTTRHVALVMLFIGVLFLPFFLTFHSLVGFAEPLVDIPVLRTLTRIVSPFTASRTGFHHFVIIFGLFALPLIAFLYAMNGTSSSSKVVGMMRWLPLVLLVVGISVGFPLLALVGVGVLAAVEAVRRVEQPAQSFVLLVLALGCAILVGTDVVYIRDVFNSRMNTVFKFYYQVWVLWGTISIYALWTCRNAGGIGTRWWCLAVGGMWLVLLLGGLVYPWVNVRDMAKKGTLVGLDGQTPREHSTAERAAVAWLRQNVETGAFLLEAVGGSYNGEGYGGISASTGIPTVIGWPGHESQWRGGDATAKAELRPREADVETIYRTLDAEEARTLLEQYGVRYVYVGTLERRGYPESLEKFGVIGEAVFQQEEVTIYRVGD